MQDIDFEAGVWAIVTDSAGRQIIGSIPGRGETEIVEMMEERTPVTIEQAFLIIANHLPAQNPQTGEMGYRPLVRCAPINNCMSPAKLTQVLTGVHFFSDMQDVDKEQHKNLVMQLQNILVEARLKASGIVTPNMTGPANGPLVRP